MKKRKGQFFVLTAIIAVFLMYLFASNVLEQVSLEATDQHKINEILYFASKEIEKINLHTQESENKINELEKVIQKTCERYKYKCELNKEYNPETSTWHIELKINTQTFDIIKIIN